MSVANGRYRLRREITQGIKLEGKDRQILVFYNTFTLSYAGPKGLREVSGMR